MVQLDFLWSFTLLLLVLHHKDIKQSSTFQNNDVLVWMLLAEKRLTLFLHTTLIDDINETLIQDIMSETGYDFCIIDIFLCHRIWAISMSKGSYISLQ